jgi:pimeloyl-ACP methyl ester carboxylesterase
VRRRRRQAQRTILTSRRPSDQTLLILQHRDLTERWRCTPLALLEKLDEENRQAPERETLFALMELCYAHARRQPVASDLAMRLLLSCVIYAYHFLFDPRYGAPPSAFHPHARFASELYNQAFEQHLRAIRRRKQRVCAGQRLPLLCGTLELMRKDSQLAWSFEEISSFELASELEVSGLEFHYEIEGIGVPLVAIHDVPGEMQGASFLPGIRQTCAATVVLHVGAPQGAADAPVYQGAVVMYDAARTETVQAGDVSLPLKADFTTPFAYMMAHAPVPVSFVAMLDVEEWRRETGLHMMQPYQPDKIPVVLVHGLMSSPFTWLRMLNTLVADRIIGSRYQFWFFMYPTGNPIVYSAQILRRSLRDMQRRYDPDGTNPLFNNMVLVGHSMGGLISKLQVINSGDHIWRNFVDVALDDLPLSGAERALFGELLVFDALPFITRVVFIATPHRGSTYAETWYARLGATVTRLHEEWLRTSTQGVRKILAQNGTRVNPVFRGIVARRMATGLDGLLPSNPMLHATSALPLAPWVTSHAIIGNQHAGGVAGGTDGIVRYASAHLDACVSEKIIKSDHCAHAHPVAIQEVRRILLAHLQQLAT